MNDGVDHCRKWFQRLLSRCAFRRGRGGVDVKKLSLLARHLDSAVVFTDARGRVEWANEAFTHLTGYGFEEVRGRTPGSLLQGPETDRNVVRHMHECRVRGEGFEVELINYKKNGEKFWTALKVQPIYDGAGRLTHYFSIKKDITQRKQAEREIRESEERYRRLVELSPDAILMHTGGRIIYVNPAAGKLFGGGSPAELLSRPVMDLIPPQERNAVQKRMRLVQEKLQPLHQLEEKFVRLDGTVFDAEVSAVPVPYHGEVVLQVVIRDISERKKAEHERRLVQFSVDRGSDAIYWLDEEARILNVNQVAEKMLGYTRNELLTMRVADISPEFPQFNWSEHWETIKKADVMTFETPHRTKDGREFPVEISANYIDYEGQEYICAFVRDVSERKELQTQLNHAQKMESIGQLAAGIAHEINTPTQFVGDNTRFLLDAFSDLGGLLAVHERLIDAAANGGVGPELLEQLKVEAERADLDYLKEEIPQAIRQSLEGLERVASIVGAMKEFSHPGSVEKAPVNINKAIENTLTISRNEWKYVAEVETDFDEDLPLVPCLVDEFNQVILNIVVNAAHAIADAGHGDGEKGKGTIRVSTRRSGEAVEIRIADTGTGIPDVIRHKVFDPFFTTKSVGKGTGQGLAVARHVVVDQHGGTIDLESEMGQGSVFIIRLPLEAAGAVEVD